MEKSLFFSVRHLKFVQMTGESRLELVEITTQPLTITPPLGCRTWPVM
jgi:hypothetical protein